MPRPLFGSASTRLMRSLIIGLLGLAIAVPAALMLWVRLPMATGQGERIQQPLPFDHRHHVHDAGLDCAYCHRLAATSAHAGMPATELCMGCHNQVLSHTEILEPLRVASATGRAIPWQRVNEVADFAVFHHGVHVSAGIDCSRCHGDVASMPLVEQAQPLTMGWCLDCHRHPQLEAADIGPGPIRCSRCHY
jgi:hypothetical protein